MMDDMQKIMEYLSSQPNKNLISLEIKTAILSEKTFKFFTAVKWEKLKSISFRNNDFI